jgi:hypothetical protein
MTAPKSNSFKKILLIYAVFVVSNILHEKTLNDPLSPESVRNEHRLVNRNEPAKIPTEGP